MKFNALKSAGCHSRNSLAASSSQFLFIGKSPVPSTENGKLGRFCVYNKLPWLCKIGPTNRYG